MPDEIQVGETAAAPEEGTTKPAKKAATKKTAAKKAPAKKATAKKTTAKKVAEPEQPTLEGTEPPAKKAAAKKTTAKKTAAKKTSAKKAAEPVVEPAVEPADETSDEAPSATAVLFQAPPAPTVTRRTRKTAAAKPAVEETPAEETPAEEPAKKPAKKAAAKKTTAKKTAAKKAAAPVEEPTEEEIAADVAEDAEDAEGTEQGEGAGEGPARRRRRRGGRRRRKPGDSAEDDGAEGDSDDSGDRADESAAGGEDGAEEGGETSSRRRRRRRRSGEDGGEGSDDPQNTVTRVRSRRSAEDEITSISGSTRLEAKKQRRRDGREAGRRRAPIVSEAEFLARRESVDRVMVIRQREELTQIGVLEDKVLVEHYVARESQTSLIGNVYLGRVQNVLPSMEAAFIDIGKGRNAVLYAGEVNWSQLGHKDGQPRKIESVLSSGQSVLVQVTKDPIGHKGARLTSQVSLAGRFLVYVPDGTTSGISRKLPDTERSRLKALLKEIVPDTAGVIVRTAAEGASEEELTRDVERLKARWEDIEGKAKGNAPQLLYGEPDLTLKVVRDLFTEDFSKLVIQGDDAWETVQSYVQHVAPDLADRLERYEPGANGQGGKADVFAEYRIEEQIAKGLDRKVWLPSGGSLIIDRTEAMTVVDVNTGKFTGSGGNLEETVTKNNLEAAEEMVRQLRLRDIGGIIVIDFIDMVLESNRDLVLRRLVECLGRDRTRHQVAEVTSLGLVQMTRKRIGTGLVESFSENCEHCQGRGVVIQDTPVEPKKADDDRARGGRRSRGRGRGGDQQDNQKDAPKDSGSKDSGSKGSGTKDSGSQDSGSQDSGSQDSGKAPSPKDVAAMPRHEVEPGAEPVVEAPVEAEAVVEASAEPVETTEEQAPAAPKVVTRSRSRRSANRPAAAPETAAEPEALVVPEPAPELAPELAPEPVAAEPEPEPAAEPVAPEPPKVVTRTRGRSATRPAGPPAEAPATDGESTESAAESDAHPVEHVPIKKKGSRKR